MSNCLGPRKVAPEKCKTVIRNPFLFVATIILGIGHIGIHLNHKKEIE
jgi:hypothetical protein